MSEFKNLVSQLSKEIVDTPEFKNLVSSLDEAKGNKDALNLFEEFQSAQAQIQSLQMTGQQPSQDQIKNWQDISEKTQDNQLIKKLSEAEMSVNNLLEEVNNALTEPLNTLYD